MGRRTSEGFVLLKGSQLSHSISEVGGDKIRLQRKKYADDLDINNSVKMLSLQPLATI